MANIFAFLYGLNFTPYLEQNQSAKDFKPKRS